MKLAIGRFEFNLTATKALPPGTSYSSPSTRGGWFRVLLEPFAGAWQRNIERTPDSILSFAAAYACVALISSDIAKLTIELVERDRFGIWNETQSPAFSPVLRKPNHFQTRIKFIENWLTSKLISGNTYILKARDNRGVVVAMYVLDPTRVQPLVAPNGDVYYQIGKDDLSRTDAIVAPARDIIHDIMVALYHPLCGVSPLTACGLAAIQGLRVQSHSSQFFANGANPGGVLTAPGTIQPDTAKRLEDKWNAEYGGENAGKVAVLGDGLKYEPMTMSAVDAQLIEQLKWTAENVCTAFRVPAYMIGVSPAPPYNNVEALNQQYYAQCLQTLIESIELLLDEGLGLDKVPDRTLGTEFDIDSLLRMDTSTRVKAAGDSIGSGAVAPNEARKRWFNLPPVDGGESPYLQQQNYSLSALAKRDAQPDPFGRSAQPEPRQTIPTETDEKSFDRSYVKARARSRMEKVAA
jgi:HK97 family phage portal protein